METRDVAFAPGEIVGGRFRVERSLGSGGMGAVLGAVDLETGRRVALKLMRYGDDATLVERFKREAEVLRAIEHPAVVGIEDAGALADGTLFLALELLEGETLARYLKREGRMPLPLFAIVMRGLAEGLAAAHARGVVHRDVKPSNIFLPRTEDVELLSRPGGHSLVKLVDFGVAKVSSGRKLTLTGSTVGTFRYMAPEQLTGVADIDARADIYALGVVAYEAIAGVHPFASPDLERNVSAILKGRYTPMREIASDVPVEVSAVIGKAMAFDRTARFASATELASAFTRSVASRSTSPRISVESGRPTLPARDAPTLARRSRWRRLALLAAAAIVSAIATAVALSLAT